MAAWRPRVRPALRLESAIIGHDRLDEVLVVCVGVRSGTPQLLDSRHSLPPEPLRIPRNSNFTRPLGLRGPTIERADEFTERGKNAGRSGCVTKPRVGHAGYVQPPLLERRVPTSLRGPSQPSPPREDAFNIKSIGYRRAPLFQSGHYLPRPTWWSIVSGPVGDQRISRAAPR
jgi:hypothetical protein